MINVLLVKEFNGNAKGLGHGGKGQTAVRFKKLCVRPNSHFLDDESGVGGEEPVSFEGRFETGQGYEEFTVAAIVEGGDEIFQEGN